MSPATPIAELSGVPKRNRQALQAMGIETVRDLFFYFPFRYEDFTRKLAVKDLPKEGAVTIVAEIVRVTSRRSFRRRMTMTEAVISDGTGKVTALWFHQPYLAKNLKTGTSYRFAGKISSTKFGPRLISPLYEPAEGPGSYAAPLLPVYSLPKGISQASMRNAVRACRPAMADVAETLPEAIRRKYGLIGCARSIEGMHFPSTTAERDAAWRRSAFEEFFRFHLAMIASRKLREARRAPSVTFDEAATRAFVKGLPFALTADQKRAAWEALLDMQRSQPMHRLLDGDVGSGKTMVAAIAAMNAARAGFQTAIMAPTEILACQHYETLKTLYAGQPFSVALWTNAYKRSSGAGGEIVCKNKKESDQLLQAVADGDIGVIVGTHALVEDRLRFDALALAVIDEQHRFGVRTRQLLCGKSGIPGAEPHLLSMTATPIPRSLALTFFGDLDLSLLREKPSGRKDIATRVVPPGKEDEAFAVVRQEIAQGRQAFVVCPLIDPSDALGAASVTEEIRRLGGGPLAGLSIGMLHGKMSSKEKEAVMAAFSGGKLQVLVSTSVVEVGVDVPNATVMCILGAERYGLAQLHQFRGRIGRGGHRSYCLLMPSNDGSAVSERLQAVASTGDGFILAEKDLHMRGPGDMLGDLQSGYPRFRAASLADAGLIKETKEAAEAALAAGALPSDETVLAEFFPVAPASVHLE